MNIVTIVQSLLTPAVVARIATALGINPSLAQMAVNAALPAILAGIAGKAAHPAGLSVLSGLVGQQNTGMLGHLGDLIGSPNQSTLVNSGSSALNTLFGQSGTAALTSAISKFTGVPEAAGGNLLGMVAPLALGTLSKQQQDTSLDTSGLAALLASQKDNIAAAMPKGLADALEDIGLFDGALAKAARAASPEQPRETHPVRSEQVTAPKAAPVAMAPPRPSAPSTAHVPAPDGGSMMRRLLPLAAAIVLGLFGWQYYSKRGPDTGTIMVNNVDVGQKTAALYEGLKSSVASIKDQATATASLPKLREQSAALLDVRDMAEKLPPDGRKRLAALVEPWLPNIEALILSALKSPGAEAVVKPVLDQIVERMTALAKG